jgi:secretion/DNA translocation related TadE-like protein
MSGTAGRAHGDRGSGAIWLLAVSLVVVLAGAVISVRGLAALARHRAESAADLAALGAATHAVQGTTDVCGVARSVAASNAARLTSCALSGAVVTVTVRCPLSRGLGHWQAQARARAGPAP